MASALATCFHQTPAYFMKLWLDDVRDPEQYWAEGFVWVKTAEHAIAKLSFGNIVFASLDYDILGEQNGMAVIDWMQANNVWPVDGVRVHSANREGHAAMQRVVDQHYPSTLTDRYKDLHKRHGAYFI